MKEVLIKRYLINDNDRIKIKTYLDENNLSQNGLALALGISNAYMSALMRGTRYITSNLRRKLKKVGINLEVN